MLAWGTFRSQSCSRGLSFQEPSEQEKLEVKPKIQEVKEGGRRMMSMAIHRFFSVVS